MKMEQVYSLMNSVTTEILGDADLLAEDLHNVVDVGKQVFDATSYDHYVQTLVNHIGRVIFVDRPYAGSAPSIRKDGWEYGAVMEKIQADLPEAVENQSWELTNGTTYNQDIFKKPTVTAKFFSDRVTFEIDNSITYIQVKESFSSPEQANAFTSMVFNSVLKSMTIKTDALIMRTLNYAIAATFLDDLPSGTYTGMSGVKAVNLLHNYNTETGKSITTANCLTDIDFLAYAVKTINNYQYRLTKMSTLFNIDAKQRFTPSNLQHLVTLSEFESSVVSTLYRNSFHDNYLTLGTHETVPFWQASGTTYAFDKCSSLDVKLGDNGEKEIKPTGVIACCFDDEAAMVTNFDLRVLTHDNKKGEFINYFYKQDAGYFFDPAENFVVFYVA